MIKTSFALASICRLSAVYSIFLLIFMPAGSLASAAVNSMNLGAKYDSTNSRISFRVYSSRATRIELYLYRNPTGAQETAKFLMTKNATNVWSKTLSVATLQDSFGITDTFYYGYRAWGPNWPFNAGWMKGSGSGFLSDVDAKGNRFNPNKLLLDPYALEISQDPTTPRHTNGAIYASGPANRNLDSGPQAPKGVGLKRDTTSYTLTGRAILLLVAK